MYSVVIVIFFIYLKTPIFKLSLRKRSVEKSIARKKINYLRRQKILCDFEICQPLIAGCIDGFLMEVFFFLPRR